MTSPRVAQHVADVDLDDYQAAARSLLVHPLVTERVPHRDALSLVRRFEEPLRADFETLARYHLEVNPTCARLVKRPLVLDATHPLRRPSKLPFDRRRYAYVCLLLAVVMRTTAQTTISHLADRLRRSASEIEQLGFDPDEHRHRCALVDALRWLEQRGALSACDGSTGSYTNDATADVLYDVDHDVAHQLFRPPAILQHQRSAAGLFDEAWPDSREGVRRRHRQRVTRLLLERPLVAVSDLTSEERAYLQREARSIASDVERFTGGSVERRGEGLALVDVDAGLTDRRFPGSSTVPQAALLLAERLGAIALSGARTEEVPTLAESHADRVERLDRVRAALLGDAESQAAVGRAVDLEEPLPDEVEDPEGIAAARGRRGADGVGERGRGAVVPDDVVRAELRSVFDEYGKAFQRDYRADFERLLGEAVDELVAFDLVRRVPGGLAVMPAIARYRVEVEVVRPPAGERQLELGPSGDSASTSHRTGTEVSR